MTRCCDWQPDPTVFGPCPHHRVATEPVRRTFNTLLGTYQALTTNPPTRTDFGLAD